MIVPSCSSIQYMNIKQNSKWDLYEKTYNALNNELRDTDEKVLLKFPILIRFLLCIDKFFLTLMIIGIDFKGWIDIFYYLLWGALHDLGYTPPPEPKY